MPFSVFKSFNITKMCNNELNKPSNKWSIEEVLLLPKYSSLMDCRDRTARPNPLGILFCKILHTLAMMNPKDTPKAIHFLELANLLSDDCFSFIYFKSRSMFEINQQMNYIFVSNRSRSIFLLFLQQSFILLLFFVPLCKALKDS